MIVSLSLKSLIIIPTENLFSISAALLALIEQRNYYISEANEVMEICVILEGMIETEVIVNITSQSDSAIGNNTHYIAIFLVSYLCDTWLVQLLMIMKKSECPCPLLWKM